MQNKTFLSFVVAATMGISGSWADKITLSNGDVLKGKVLEETDTEYILEVFITSTIKDRKTFKKSEVESIEAEAPDKKPFEELADILPTNDAQAGFLDRGGSDELEIKVLVAPDALAVDL